MSARVAFRVDAGSRMGTGHFMRCLTLAQALAGQGARVCFVSRGLPSHLSDMLVARGIDLLPLPTATARAVPGDLPHSSWLDVTQAQDAADTARALAGVGAAAWDWLVVDHYALDARWESPMREAARHILVIDDLADRPHDCDLLLDQNHYAEMEGRYAGKVPGHCRTLLGPRYALLREDFHALRSRDVRSTDGRVRRVLVFFGGVDAANLTGRVIEALAALRREGIDLTVDVVVGAQHPCLGDIERACALHGDALHVQTPRMAELMAQADLAIGAGGVAVWERCSLGLPGMSLCVADNQRRQIADAAAAGLIYALPECGPDDAVLPALLARHVRCLIENPPLLQALSRRSMDAVDGLGAVRVAALLDEAGDVSVRPATEADARMMFEWRNHPSVRAASHHAGEIDWPSHRDWVAAVLKDPDRDLLIGCADEGPMGVVRFDRRDGMAEVSIYLAPGMAARGRGRKLLSAAQSWLVSRHPAIGAIRAEVLGGNTVSQRLFTGAGYVPRKIDYLKHLHEKDERPDEDR